MEGGWFDWGGRLLNGNGGARSLVQAVWKSALRVQKHKPGYIKLPLSIFHDFAARCIVIQALAGVRQLALLMGMESLSDFCML